MGLNEETKKYLDIAYYWVSIGIDKYERKEVRVEARECIEEDFEE